MPAYRITGIGGETDRKRVRVYETDTMEDAFEKAFKDGTIVDIAATEIVPGKPPTENQFRLVTQTDRLVSLRMNNDYCIMYNVGFGLTAEAFSFKKRCYVCSLFVTFYSNDYAVSVSLSILEELV